MSVFLGLLIGLLCLGLLLWVVGFMEGERPLLDNLYESLLTGRRLDDLDRCCADRLVRSDVVICLTSIPSRIGLIEPALKSLLNQEYAAREIRLYLPALSRREGVPYQVPEWLHGLRCVRIIECDRDWGPATKFIPAVLESADNQMLLIVDDDRIYPPNLIRDLTAAADKLPDTALCMTGWNAPIDLIDRPTTIWSNLFMQAPAPIRGRRLRRPLRVDILQGMSGYLLKPKFFDRAQLVDYSAAPEAAFFVDDVWMSAHCRAPRYVIPTRRAGFPVKRWFARHKESSLGHLNRGGGDVNQRNNSVMLKYFGDRWLVAKTGN
jgi:hypothetical protein